MNVISYIMKKFAFLRVLLLVLALLGTATALAGGNGKPIKETPVPQEGMKGVWDG